MNLDEFNEVTEQSVIFDEQKIFFTFNDKNYCPFCGEELSYKDSNQFCNHCSDYAIKHSLYLQKIFNYKKALLELSTIKDDIVKSAKKQLAKKYEEEVYPQMLEEEAKNLEDIINSVKS